MTWHSGNLSKVEYVAGDMGEFWEYLRVHEYPQMMWLRFRFQIPLLSARSTHGQLTYSAEILNSDLGQKRLESSRNFQEWSNWLLGDDS